ncbi:uncharacterized protein LOC131232362 [Magnolia sinica]|uniref:uncharacterized protein LOC131232362 n=1 Tax=Magnolia sinica TaxID=86752 RepID=UPI0026588070|nr:uncharacterized protein LOC131232362 [Magnolia sinica]
MASLHIERPQGGLSNYHEDDQQNLSDDEDYQQNLSDDEDYQKNPEYVERKELFQSAMTSKWEVVLAKYKNEPRIQKVKITSTEDTLLHIAVTDDRKEVTELVDAVTKVEILEMKNDMGNTPLHLAAAMGKVGMCKCIVKKYRQLFFNRQYVEQPKNGPTDLIDSRNKEGETPLFVAAVHGKKEAFLYLYYRCPRGVGGKYWIRSSDGNSILHVAISGEYFGLAFDMLKKCHNKRHDLINSVNERGLTPLHLIASNPSAFQSGTHLRRIEAIIYEYIVVEPLKETDVKSALAEAIRREDESREKPSDVLPKNYRILMDLFTVLRRVFNIKDFQCLRLWPQKQEKNQLDAENPSPQISASTENPPPQISASTDIFIQRSHGDGGKSHESSQERSCSTQEQPFPSNYKTCYDFFELAMTALQVIGFGYIRMQKIKERKQKHTWAVQIMDELVKKASSWEYNAGSKPQDRAPDPISQAFSDGSPVDYKEEEKNVARSPNSSQKPNELKEDEGKMTDILNKILNIPPKLEKVKRSDDKNTIQMTMENKQPHIYSLIMEMKKENEDDGGNVIMFIYTCTLADAFLYEHIRNKIHEVKPTFMVGIIYKIVNTKAKCFEAVRAL